MHICRLCFTTWKTARSYHQHQRQAHPGLALKTVSTRICPDCEYPVSTRAWRQHRRACIRSQQ